MDNCIPRKIDYEPGARSPELIADPKEQAKRWQEVSEKAISQVRRPA
jgi:hypothetical protein